MIDHERAEQYRQLYEAERLKTASLRRSLEIVVKFMRTMQVNFPELDFGKVADDIDTILELRK